jgi:hypothetical protein
LLVAAALAVAAVPGASAVRVAAPVLLAYGPAVISPNGNGVHDDVTFRVRAAPGSQLGLGAYAWGGRLHGWRQLRTGGTVTASPSGEAVATWGATTSDGRTLGDGSYLVTLCYKDPGARLAPVIPAAEQRPGVAEATVSSPPWRYAGCLARPRVVRVERLAAYVNSTGSFEPGSRPPLVVSADRGQASTQLEQDCSGRRLAGLAGRLSPGLYHYVVTDPAGDVAEAPVVVRSPAFPLDRPPPHTALVVWPYLTWRAYNGYDANLNGIPDSWYQFWRQRRVSLVGTILPGGREDDFKATVGFSHWLCSRAPRIQSITDVELGKMPLSALRRYSAVWFPGHSEYYVPSTWRLLRRYRDGGGNLVFLQANPFYRGVRLDRAHNAMVMTDFDARDRGYSDFALAGVGYDGCCFPLSHAVRLVAATGADYALVRWLFKGTGIGPGDSFGYAGSESDRIDPQLTPRDHVVAAEGIVAGNYGVVNAALTWTRAGRGQTIATGNYDFLRMRRSVTWPMLDNIWRKLVSS